MCVAQVELWAYRAYTPVKVRPLSLSFSIRDPLSTLDPTKPATTLARQTQQHKNTHNLVPSQRLFSLRFAPTTTMHPHDSQSYPSLLCPGLTGSALLRQCDPGEWIDEVGMCQRCSQNTISPGDLATECTACPTGTFAAPGSSSCAPCAAGEYWDTGLMKCFYCPVRAVSVLN